MKQGYTATLVHLPFPLERLLAQTIAAVITVTSQSSHTIILSATFTYNKVYIVQLVLDPSGTRLEL